MVLVMSAQNRKEDKTWQNKKIHLTEGLKQRKDIIGEAKANRTPKTQPLVTHFL